MVIALCINSIYRVLIQVVQRSSFILIISEHEVLILNAISHSSIKTIQFILLLNLCWHMYADYTMCIKLIWLWCKDFKLLAPQMFFMFESFFLWNGMIICSYHFSFLYFLGSNFRFFHWSIYRQTSNLISALGN